MLSIPVGIMFPIGPTLTLRCTMSPELVDQTILACCKPQFLKVARILVDVATALKVPTAVEKPGGTEVDFIADRIKALFKTGTPESTGNLDRWRYSEIRLTGK